MELYFLKTIGPYKRFTERDVPERLAKFYIKHGIAEKVVPKAGVYHTKVMIPAVEVDLFSGLTIEQMRELLNQRGVKYHHRAGIDKLKELLKGQ